MKLTDDMFITGDLHLGHQKILEYENRPFATIKEMDEAIIDN
jgi:calcineurin-like phosphoesterase family protein